MNIKRIFVFILALILLATCFTSCKKGEEDGATAAPPKKMCTVKFNSNCDAVIAPKNIIQGERVGEPEAPVKEGFVFDGWYNETNNIKWDFAFDKVEDDLKLYAKWLKPGDVFKFDKDTVAGTAVITGIKREAYYLTIPAEIEGYTVVGIAAGAFASSSSETYKRITVPKSVTVIGEKAFQNCVGIEIVVESALTSVGEYAFEGCTGLKSVTFAEDVELIAPESFEGSGLTFLYIPESVKAIEENAFSGCAALQKVMLHAKDIEILDSAFRDSGVKAVYLYGTEEEADSLFEERTEAFNDNFLNANIYLYSENEPEGETGYNGYWYFDGKGQTRIWS